MIDSKNYFFNKKLKLAILLLFTPFAIAKSIEWPEFPVPDGSNVEIVAYQISNNGLPLHILNISVEDSLNNVVGFYKDSWPNNGSEIPGYVENTVGDSVIISHFDQKNSLMYAAELKEKLGRTYGTLSISDLSVFKEKSNFKPGVGVPIPEKTTVLNDLKAEEVVGDSRTLILSSKLSVNMCKEYYRKNYSSDDWVESSYNMKESNERAVLLFNKPNQEVQIVISRDDSIAKTNIVMVIESKSGV